MLMTKRRPVPVGTILKTEFMDPLRLTQGHVAEAMGVERKHVNQICNGRRSITATTALMLARVFNTSPDFWLNLQKAVDLWDATHDKDQAARIDRAKPIVSRAALS
jgi:addiction module HigA family antidote